MVCRKLATFFFQANLRQTGQFYKHTIPKSPYCGKPSVKRITTRINNLAVGFEVIKAMLPKVTFSFENIFL